MHALFPTQAGVGGGGLYIRHYTDLIPSSCHRCTKQIGINSIASPNQILDIKLVNSTVSGNTVANGAGGGLYLRESGEANDSLHITLLNSKVTENAAGQGAGVYVFQQQSTTQTTGTLRLTNHKEPGFCWLL